MEYADFSNPNKNRILTAIEEEFKDAVNKEQGAKRLVRHCPGGGPEVEGCNLSN
jgi:hypothetical protein